MKFESGMAAVVTGELRGLAALALRHWPMLD